MQKRVPINRRRLRTLGAAKHHRRPGVRQSAGFPPQATCRRNNCSARKVDSEPGGAAWEREAEEWANAAAASPATDEFTRVALDNRSRQSLDPHLSASMESLF